MAPQVRCGFPPLLLEGIQYQACLLNAINRGLSVQTPLDNLSAVLLEFGMKKQRSESVYHMDGPAGKYHPRLPLPKQPRNPF